MKYNILKIDAIAFDHCNCMWKYDISCHYVATKTTLRYKTYIPEGAQGTYRQKIRYKTRDVILMHRFIVKICPRRPFFKFCIQVFKCTFTTYALEL